MSEIRQRGARKEGTSSLDVASNKFAVLDFSSDAIDNGQLLLRAYFPVLALLLLYGGRPVILVTCFGGMLAYTMDLAQLKEGTISVLILTGLGQWASLLWASADLIGYSKMYLIFMAVIGIFLIHMQYVCISQFRSYWLEFAGPFAETAERIVFASAPIVATPLFCWPIAVQVEGVHLPSAFALVFFCYAYVLYTPRQATSPEAKVARKHHQTPSQQHPLITLPLLLYSYGILAFLPFILHCSIHWGEMLSSMSHMFAALYSWTMPTMLCTFLADHHMAYFRQDIKASVQRLVWSIRAVAGLGTLICGQSHPLFADLKRLAPVGEPLSSIIVATTCTLLFIGVILLRGVPDELLNQMGVRVRSTTIASICVYIATAVGVWLLQLPVVQSVSVAVGAGLLTQYYLSRNLILLGGAALLAASLVFWYTHHKMWYLSHTFDWLLDVSIQSYCLLLVALIAMAVFLPGVARNHHQHGISAGAIAFALLLAIAELVVREHPWAGVKQPHDVYPDTLLMASAFLMVLTMIHLRRINAIGGTPLWTVVAINAAKLFSVLGWDSHIIFSTVFVVLTFIIPHIFYSQPDDGQPSRSLAKTAIAAAAMALASYAAYSTVLPFLFSEYSYHSPGPLQALFLSLSLWSVGVLLLLVRYHPNVYLVKRLLLAATLCCVFGAASPVDTSASTFVVWSDDTTDEQIFQLDMILLCGALVLLGLFKIIPLQSNLGIRVVYAVVLGVISGIYLGSFLIGPSLLGFYYAVVMTFSTVMISQQAFLASASAQSLVQAILPVLCVSPFICTFGGLWLETSTYHLTEDHWSNALVGIWWLFGICTCAISTCLWAAYQATNVPLAGARLRRSEIGVTVGAPDRAWMIKTSSFLAVMAYAALIFAGHRSPRPRWHVDVVTLPLACISVLFSIQKNTGRLSMMATWNSKVSQFLSGYLLFAVSALVVSAIDMLFVDGMLGYFISPPGSQTISEAYDVFGVRNDEAEDIGFWIADGIFAPATNVVWFAISVAPTVAFLYSHYYGRSVDFNIFLLFLPATALVFTQLTSVRLIAALSVLAWSWQTYLAYKQRLESQRLI